MKTVYKILGILCFVFAVLLLLLALIMVTGGESGIGAFFAIFGLFFVFLGWYSRNYSRKNQVQNTQPQDPAPRQVSETPAPVATIPETPAPAASTSTIERKPIPKYKPAEDCDSYNFAVAGVYYHQDEIIEGLMEENPEYELTKKEIKEDGLEDTFLYKYGIAFTSAELVPEPENPHDPNAIKVIADGVFVGHVPAKETKAVRKIMDEKKIIKTECQIYGGDYKVLDYDSSSIRKGSTNLKAVVSIKYK